MAWHSGLLVCIDVVAVLVGLILVLVLAHGVDEKMLFYYAVSNMSMLFCCAMIGLLCKSCSEGRVLRKNKNGRGPRTLSIVVCEKVPTRSAEQAKTVQVVRATLCLREQDACQG
jgi:hypothetical protein